MAAKKIANKTTTPVPDVADKTPKPTAKKAVAKKAAVRTKKVAAEPVAKKTVAKPSLDDLARAAYLNYRRRVEQSLPGDSHGDWLEAERQFSGQV